MMRKWLLLAALCWGIGGLTSVWAQEDGPGENGNRGENDFQGPLRGGPMATLSLEQLKTSLKLTDEQAQKLEPLLKKIKAAFDAMHKKMSSSRHSGHSGGGMADMRKKMEQLKKKILEILAPAKEFLSDEQYQALVKKLTARPAPPNGGRGGSDGDSESADGNQNGMGENSESAGGSGGRRGGPMAMLNLETLKTALKLTDEQAEKLEPLVEKAKKLFAAMHKEMRPGRNHGNRGGMDDMRKTMEQFQKKLLAVFVPAREFLSDEQYQALVKKLTARPPVPRGGADGDRAEADGMK